MFKKILVEIGFGPSACCIVVFTFTVNISQRIEWKLESVMASSNKVKYKAVVCILLLADVHVNASIKKTGKLCSWSEL